VTPELLVVLDEALSVVAEAAERAYLQGLADAAFDEIAPSTSAERAAAHRLEAERLGSITLAGLLARLNHTTAGRN
jgi:hypothetical protein